MAGLEQKVATAVDFAKDAGTFFAGTTEEIMRRAVAGDRMRTHIYLLIGEVSVFALAITNQLPGEETTSFLRYMTFDSPYAGPFAVDGGVRLVRMLLPLVMEFGIGLPPTGAIGTVREIGSYAAQLGRRYLHRES